MVDSSQRGGPADPHAILDPTGGAPRGREGVRLAAPRARLAGATIGLLENTKHNASLFLAELGQLLVDRYGVAGVVARTKLAFALPVSADLLEELATSCQAVVTGVGDCGSCSGSAVADGVAFERRGIPAAVVCTDAFTVTADAMAALKGAQGYRYATTAHPVAVLTPDEVRKRASEALPQVVKLLTGAEA
jgi:predicted ATP-grasp superfamily ATP-dependent carboligase